MIDIEKLLEPTPDDPPCGPNLEYDPVFLAMEQSAQGKPDQQFGETVIAAEGPDWPNVQEQALALFARTKDLRVAVQLTRALVSTSGLAGLNAGFKLIHEMLARYWENVHPELDAEDDNDPTMRLNSLAPLVDAEGLLRDLHRRPLVRSRTVGQILVRDAEIALGKVPAPTEGAPYSLDQIESMLRAIAAEDSSQIDVVREAEQAVRSLYAFLSEKVGADRATDLRPLAGLLSPLTQLCDRVLGSTSATSADAAEEAATPGGAPGTVALQVIGDVRSRDDALRLLDKVCDYLERNEPANPAPLLIKRAKRLMTMNFLDILEDMAPDSVSNVQMIAGIKPD
ncbi:MAG: type VI secretion system protein TssA [Rhodocyclaceae bacterium]